MNARDDDAEAFAKGAIAITTTRGKVHLVFGSRGATEVFELHPEDADDLATAIAAAALLAREGN